MAHPELLILGVLRALVEVAMLFLLGQGLLALLAGRGRNNNPMDKLFGIITGPVVKAILSSKYSRAFTESGSVWVVFMAMRFQCP